MSDKVLYPIKYVSQHTGLKPYIIRSWEFRYQAVCPHRTASNRRMYTDQEIHRLELLRRAVECGHTISAVAGLTDAELQVLEDRALSGPTEMAPLASGSPGSPTEPIEERCQKMVARALNHVIQLEAVALETALNAAAVDVPRHAFLQHIVVPLFSEIGRLWSDGKLKIVNEHMASNIVRSMLWDMLRTVRAAKSAPRALIATPVGHWHEFGALASALAAAESGWQAVYFGPNLPAEEIVYTLTKTKARVLILSLSHHLNDSQFALELKKLRRLSGERLPILVGGYGVSSAYRAIEDIRAERVESLKALRKRLDALLSGMV